MGLSLEMPSDTSVNRNQQVSRDEVQPVFLKVTNRIKHVLIKRNGRNIYQRGTECLTLSWLGV